MVAPAIIAAARVAAPKVVARLAPKVVPRATTAAKTVRTAAAPALAKLGVKTTTPKAAQTAIKTYAQGTSKGASIAAGAKLASKVVPKTATGKIITAAALTPVAKDLYGKVKTSSKSGAGMSPSITGREEIYGGFSEVGGVEGGAFEAMPTVGSAARVGALPQVQGLLADPKVKAALVGVGLIGAAAEAAGVIDVIPGFGRPKAKTTKKRKTTKKTTAKKTAAKRAAGASFKALAAKWKKLSPQAKARYEGRFSEYIKVHREKAISSKSKPTYKKRTTKRTTKKRSGGKRKMSGKMKAQQSKMRAAAKKWKSYKGSMSYKDFMSKELKR